MDNFLFNVAIIGPMLLFSVIAHEIAHGYAALKQGDPTAYQLGRLTWNPIKHIDPFFTIVLPLVMILLPGNGIIGGAKPVPVDPRNYRNFKRGDIIVSLAGVATNAVISIACVLLIALLGGMVRVAPQARSVVEIAQGILAYGVYLNWILIIFNLLPIPPLDGSHVMKYLLPPAWSLQYTNFGARFGFLILIGLMMLAPQVLSMLLPVRRSDDGIEAEDPRAELVRRLLEYEQMKLAAAKLDALPLIGRDFLRAQVVIEQSLAPRFPDVDVADLRTAWIDIVRRAKLVQHHHITREQLSVREYMSMMLRRLQGQRFVEFNDLFDTARGTPVVVVTFIALLELARESLLEVTQAEAFAPIYVRLAYQPA